MSWLIVLLILSWHWFWFCNYGLWQRQRTLSSLSNQSQKVSSQLSWSGKIKRDRRRSFRGVSSSSTDDKRIFTAVCKRQFILRNPGVFLIILILVVHSLLYNCTLKHFHYFWGNKSNVLQSDHRTLLCALFSYR